MKNPDDLNDREIYDQNGKLINPKPKTMFNGSLRGSLPIIALISSVMGGLNFGAKPFGGNYHDDDDYDDETKKRFDKNYVSKKVTKFSKKEELKLSTLSGKEKKKFVKELKEKYR